MRNKRRSSDLSAGFAVACLTLGVHVSGPASAQDANDTPPAPVAGRVLGTSVRTRDAEELQYHVMKALVDRYALEQGIVASRTEIEEYVARTKAGLAKERLEAIARRDELTRRLSAGNLTSTEQASLSGDLRAQELLIEGLAGSDGGADGIEEKAAREQIAEAFILQWKVNQALYRQYRGRVVYQQTGPEPLDARRRFLEARQAGGDFEILDKQLEPGFWRYFRTDSLHSFYPSGSPEEAAAFARPPWLEN